MRDEPVREIARGKWPAILGGIMTERMLSGRHGPCPVCGTKGDKFRFDDKDGTGSWICTCSAGDGFALLESVNGWTFAEAAKFVESVAGRFKAQPAKQGRSGEDAKTALRSAWEGSRRVESGDPVYAYLERRCGVRSVSNAVRFHPSLAYRHESGEVTYHPAMLAQVVGGDSVPVSIHRTYLAADGMKANVPVQKKLMTGTRKMENVAVRLARPLDGWMGVAEGIETALCASRKHGIAVWSCVSAGLLETFRPPAGIKLVTIFGDNDTSYTGQASAYRLAKAIVASGIECRVAIPEKSGTDWADT